MNNIGIYIMLIIGTMVGAFGGYFFKKCTGSDKGIKGIILSPFLYLGGVLYLVSAVLNIIVLRYLPYSVTLPLTSITYVWSMMISYLFLKEKITKIKITGFIIILIGVVFLAI